MKKFYFILSLVMLAFVGVRAADIPVESPEDLSGVFASAQDGDVLLLAPGIYSTGINMPAGRVLTLKSADPADRAEITFQINGVADLNYTVDGKNGGLILDDLKIKRGNAYFMDLGQSGQSGTLDLIAFRNCEITDVKRSLIQSSVQSFTIEKIEVSNCLVHDCNTESWNHMYMSTPVHEVVFENCTYYNNFVKDANGNAAIKDNGDSENAMEAFFSARANNNTHPFNFVFKNNTIYQGGRKSGTKSYPICNVGSNYDPEASYYLFENNIFIAPQEELPGSPLVKANGAIDVVVKNNLIYNYPLVYDVAEVYGDEDTETNFSLEDFSFASYADVFPNPKGGDFTVYANSALATAGSDGGMIGDPRWLKEAANMVTLTVGYKEGSSSDMGTIEGPKGQIPQGETISLTAQKKFGYKFVQWVDGGGAILSTDATYEFEMDADKSVFAEFASVPVYTLTVNIQGNGGRVEYSNKGHNGEFKYEAGAEVMLEAFGNPIADFAMWSDNDNNTFKIITMDSDQIITAIFAAQSFIVGWDFTSYLVDNPGNNYEPDYMDAGVDTDYPPLMTSYLYDHGNVSLKDGGMLRDQGGRICKQHWGRRPSGAEADPAQEYFYWETSISTKGYGDVTVDYAIYANYSTNKSWKFLYSYNGTAWEVAETIELPYRVWTDKETVLPNTGDLDVLYLRWMPDLSTELHAGPADVDGVGFTNIFVKAENLTAVPSHKENTIEAVVNSGVLTISGVTVDSEAYLVGIDGRMVSRFAVSAGETIKAFPALQGIYILHLNGSAKKLIF